MQQDRVQGFVLGAVSASIVGFSIYLYLEFSRNARLAVHADDEAHSMFYEITPPGGKGRGFPFLGTTKAETIARLKTVHTEYSRLPFEMYKSVVENLPICCVDVICRRQDGKLLLFYRRDKPANNIWWWPGGRMFKGETFYDSAVRKIKDETGRKDAHVKPVGIVTAWNTFFPDSHWDAERKPGREGTQTVNIVVVCDIIWDESYDHIELADSASNRKQANDAQLAPAAKEALPLTRMNSADDWAVDAHKWISAHDALVPGMYDKYITTNVNLAIQMGLL